jgi:hypothetical protein
MRFECWINKGYKQSVYVTLTAFHGKKVYANATQYYVYSTLLGLFSATLGRISHCLGNITTAITAP